MKIEVIRVTRHVFTRQGDVYLPVEFIRKAARRLQEASVERPDRAFSPFDPECPFRFIDPKTVETIEEDLNHVRSCELPNIPYHVLKRLCQSQNCCASIESVASGLGVDEESVINAIDDKINGVLRRRGICWKVERKSGFLTLKRSDG